MAHPAITITVIYLGGAIVSTLLPNFCGRGMLYRLQITAQRGWCHGCGHSPWHALGTCRPCSFTPTGANGSKAGLKAHVQRQRDKGAYAAHAPPRTPPLRQMVLPVTTRKATPVQSSPAPRVRAIPRACERRVCGKSLSCAPWRYSRSRRARLR